MNRIAAINGSPKVKNSVSGMLIDKIAEITMTKISVLHAIHVSNQKDAKNQFNEIFEAEALLLVFPLYVDSLPAPLIKTLNMLESAARSYGKPLPKVFAVCNCGFYEAEHNRLALDIVRNFCDRAGFSWGYGVGIGGGGMIGFMPENMAKGPAAHAYKALLALASDMLNGSQDAKNVYAAPAFPRFLYKLGGHMGWYRMAKANGVRKTLRATPHKTNGQ